MPLVILSFWNKLATLAKCHSSNSSSIGSFVPKVHPSISCHRWFTVIAVVKAWHDPLASRLVNENKQVMRAHNAQCKKGCAQLQPQCSGFRWEKCEHRLPFQNLSTRLVFRSRIWWLDNPKTRKTIWIVSFPLSDIYAELSQLAPNF